MFLHKMELLYADKVAKFFACFNQAKSYCAFRCPWSAEGMCTLLTERA